MFQYWGVRGGVEETKLHAFQKTTQRRGDLTTLRGVNRDGGWAVKAKTSPLYGNEGLAWPIFQNAKLR